MDSSLINYLRLLKPVPGKDAETITSHFTLKHYKEDEFLIRSDTIAREMFFVCKGVIRIGSVTDKGTERTHYFYNENRLVSIIQSFNEEKPSGAFIQACCDVEVAGITRGRLLDLYQALPYIKELVEQQNQLHLIEKVNTHNNYLGEEAENKYKLFVMQFPDIALRVPQKHIASYLGITPQSLSRIRRQIR